MNLLKRLLVFAFLIGAVQGVSCQQPTADGVRHADPAEFRKLSKGADVVILDVRTPQEFSEGHLTGARNLDFSSEGFSASLPGMDKNTPYLVYCKSGRRSAMAASQMKDAGFKNVTDLKGGITAWQEARLPVERN
ncbi:MAG: rhodanese-like domain-containing protein [Bacteroidota bacterium]